jgi:AcrR family transcriptional regulator
MPVKSRRARNAEATRALVIETAGELWAERGYDDTSIDHIADAAGTSKGAVYHHFVDKRALFEAVFRDELTRLLDAVAASYAAAEDPWERVGAAIEAFLRASQEPRCRRLLFDIGPAALGPVRYRQIDDELVVPLIVAMLDDLVVHGELDPGPTDLAARVLFSASVEGAQWVAAQGRPTAIAEATTFLRSLLQGPGPTG